MPVHDVLVETVLAPREADHLDVGLLFRAPDQDEVVLDDKYVLCAAVHCLKPRETPD